MNHPHVSKCPGSGERAVCDVRSGFFGCPTCKTIQGVMLRASHLTPDHAFGDAPPLAPGDSRYELHPGHESVPMLMVAAQQGLPTSWAMDLLVQYVHRMRAAQLQAAEQTAKPAPRIILTGMGGNG